MCDIYGRDICAAAAASTNVLLLFSVKETVARHGVRRKMTSEQRCQAALDEVLSGRYDWGFIDSQLGLPDATDDVQKALWVAFRKTIPTLVKDALRTDTCESYRLQCLAALWLIRLNFDPKIEVPWDELPGYPDLPHAPRTRLKILLWQWREKETIAHYARVWDEAVAAGLAP